MGKILKKECGGEVLLVEERAWSKAWERGTHVGTGRFSSTAVWGQEEQNVAPNGEGTPARLPGKKKCLAPRHRCPVCHPIRGTPSSRRLPKPCVNLQVGETGQTAFHEQKQINFKHKKKVLFKKSYWMIFHINITEVSVVSVLQLIKGSQMAVRPLVNIANNRV